MAYHIEIDEALVLAYLCRPDRGLADADIDILLGFLVLVACLPGLRPRPAWLGELCCLWGTAGLVSP